MSKGIKLVGPAEFCRQTGLTKPTFYNLLEQMVEVGAAAKTQRKIDMNCQWMQSYLARNKTVQRKMSGVTEETEQEIINDVQTIEMDELPPMNVITHMKEAETFNKLRIDNAIKSKRVVSKKIVLLMIEKIDDAFNKVIMDGEASFIPQLIQKIKAGCIIEQSENGDHIIVFSLPEEDIKKFWRKEIGKILNPVKPFMTRVINKFLEDNR